MASPLLPPERPGHVAPPDLAERRAGLIAAVAAGTWRTDPAPQQTMIAGVRALRFDPPAKSRATLLHVHGGAFRIGSPETIAPFAAALAARCAVTVIVPAYRLAPEHPFPAGLHDAHAVWAALVGSDKQALILSGDSAGGAIATGLTALVVAAGASPAGLALLSPWLDLTVTSTCFQDNAASDPLFSTEAAREAATLYLQGVSPRDPLASPFFGSVDGFPPTLINVGDGEVLADDARRFRDKLRAAGVAVQLDVIDSMEHVAVTRDRTLAGAAQAFDTLAAFVDTLLPTA